VRRRKKAERGKKMRAKQKGRLGAEVPRLSEKNFRAADSAMLPCLFRITGMLLPRARVPPRLNA
jgi:hypothetical protein